jgi:imidazolonepropionase-like amidohydrolase
MNHPSINQSSRLLILALALLLTGAAVVAFRTVRSVGKKAELHARCAAEGEAAVISFLKTGGHGAFQTHGTFAGLAGTGFSPPVWNTSGHFFLWMDRTASFSGGAVPIRIYVTEGRKTAPGATALGTPQVDAPGRISVSHPDLVP